MQKSFLMGGFRPLLFIVLFVNFGDAVQCMDKDPCAASSDEQVPEASVPFGFVDFLNSVEPGSCGVGICEPKSEPKAKAGVPSPNNGAAANAATGAAGNQVPNAANNQCNPPQQVIPFGWNRRDGYCMPESPETVINRALLNWLMRKDGLPKLLSDPKWDYKKILGECATYSVLNALLQEPVKGIRTVLGRGIELGVSTGGNILSKAWNLLFHNGAPHVTYAFLRLIKNRIDDIVGEIQKEAHQSSIDGNVGEGLLRSQQYKDANLDAARDDAEAAAAAANSKDVCWDKISSIYIMQIVQLVNDIRKCQAYYSPDDSIIISSSNLIIVLEEIVNQIENAEKMADLAAPDVSRMIQLLRNNANATISELEILIQVKANEEKKTKGLFGGGHADDCNVYDRFGY